MKKILILFANILLVLGFNIQASPWTYVPNQGDTGWQTYTYTAGPEGFTGVAGFVVSNVIDNSAYSELLLDNLSQGGGAEGINRGFEQGNLSGYDLVGTSFATVSTSATSISGTTYDSTQGDFLADLQGLSDGVTTSQFYNATGQAGTVGSILETEITLGAGATFSFDWAFLGNDQSPWNDFAMFYLKDQTSGAIVFSEGLAQIGSASSCNAYDYKFTYANGDYYTGTVYATPEYGYSINYTQTITDENNQTGNYVITGVTPGFDASKAGQVYVPSYYDYESDQTYTPVSNGTAVGTGYLGSERDYIIKSGVPEYLFGLSGSTFYEADLASYAYAFKYTYGNGDYYTGTVYAAPEKGYSTSYTQSATDENGQTGTYTISSVTTGQDVSKAGQVYVTSYYDQESGNTYTPVGSGAAVGSSFLGSEHDYIIKSGVPEYLFGLSGSTFYEADLASYAYAFKYTYGDGDYYTGTVYAAPEKGYSTSYTQSATDENGQTGTYTISSVTTGQDVSKAGQVYVTSYYDQESGNTYTPVGSGAAVGSSFLGSEADYIIMTDIPEFKFGKGGSATFYEADVGNISRYDFTFSYSSGSGDYYVGYVYAPTSFQTSGPGLAVGSYLYDQPMEFWNRGYKSFNGGYYYITAITDGFSSSYDKQSYITSYYDANSAKASLGVNTDASSTATYIYVADRTADFESGYAISGSQHAAFDPYTEANVTITASSPASSSPALSSTLTSVNASQSQGQAIWGNYWGQTDNLLDEEKYPLGK